VVGKSAGSFLFFFFIFLFFFSLFSGLKLSDCRVSRAGAGRKPACLWACIIYNLILNFAPVGHLRVKIFTPKLRVCHGTV
jgi:hypothetical protein